MDQQTGIPTRGQASPGSVERLVAEEHGALRVHLGHLRELAAELPSLDEAVARKRARDVLGFLEGTLLTHAAAEEASLYPSVESLLCAGATKTMILDHEAIRSLTGQVRSTVDGLLGAHERAEAQRLLLVLDGLVTTHLWKEDAAYLPLLAGLAPDAYADLHAAIAAHAQHHEHEH